MKKLLLFTFSLIVSFSALSQKRVSVGFKLSGSMNLISTSYPGTLMPKQGYSAGILTEIKIINPISIRIEALFANRGFKDKITYTDHVGNAYKEDFVKASLNYIDVPVMAKFSIGKVVKPYAIIGGKGSLFLNGSIKYPSIPGSSTGNRSYKYEASLYDYGALGGLGVDFNLGKLNMFTEFIYTHNFVTIDNYGTKFRSLELSAGLKF